MPQAERRGRVAILSKTCAHWIMTDLAIWMAGYVSVPIYPTLTAASVRQILEHSEARACFLGKLDDWPSMKSGIPEAVHCIRYPIAPEEPWPQWHDILAKTAPVKGNPVRAADELATIIYTSGTTGMPKGVMHSFANIAWAASSCSRARSAGRPAGGVRCASARACLPSRATPRASS